MASILSFASAFAVACAWCALASLSSSLCRASARRDARRSLSCASSPSSDVTPAAAAPVAAAAASHARGTTRVWWKEWGDTAELAAARLEMLRTPAD